MRVHLMENAGYRQVLGRFTTGVTVVSAWRGPGVADGVTVSAFSAVSLQPPLVLACIGGDSDCHRLLRESTWFGVSILARAQAQTAYAFAGLGAAKRDALAALGAVWAGDEARAPLLADCLATLVCERVEVFEAGDHSVLIGAVHEGRLAGDRQPLVYYASAFRELAEPAG